MPIEYYQQDLVDIRDILELTAASRYIKIPAGNNKILDES
jgi:hypothetical protein